MPISAQRRIAEKGGLFWSFPLVHIDEFVEAEEDSG